MNPPESTPEKEEGEDSDANPFSDDEEMFASLCDAIPTKPEPPLILSSDDETLIDEDEKGEVLGSDSDMSVDEPATAEDREFIDDTESNGGEPSHAALYQTQLQNAETQWLNRFVYSLI